MTKCACPTCQEKTEIVYPVNVGEFAESSGWKAVIVEDKTIWFCPFHKDRIEVLAKEIFVLTGTRDVFFSTLLPRKFEG